MGGCASAPIKFKKEEAPEPEEQVAAPVEVEKKTDEAATAEVEEKEEATAEPAGDAKNPSLGALLKEGEGEEKKEEEKKEAEEEKKEIGETTK